jgi:hypothetical protein
MSWLALMLLALALAAATYGLYRVIKYLRKG